MLERCIQCVTWLPDSRTSQVQNRTCAKLTIKIPGESSSSTLNHPHHHIMHSTWETGLMRGHCGSVHVGGGGSYPLHQISSTSLLFKSTQSDS